VNKVFRKKVFCSAKRRRQNHAAHIHLREKENPHIADEWMFRDFPGINKESFLRYKKMEIEAAEKYRF
jgi:hypothetical protein